jgi:hypothetical protein
MFGKRKVYSENALFATQRFLQSLFGVLQLRKAQEKDINKWPFFVQSCYFDATVFCIKQKKTFFLQQTH